MLRNAAEIERATHHVALYIDAPDDRVREHPGPAIIAALSISGFPLTSGFTTKTLISQAAGVEELMVVYDDLDLEAHLAACPMCSALHQPCQRHR